MEEIKTQTPQAQTPEEIRAHMLPEIFHPRTRTRYKNFLLELPDLKPDPAPTGIKSLDAILSGGIHKGLTIIGAESSRGKTTLALQICDNIAKSGRRVVIFTLEMSAQDLIIKSLSRETAISALNFGNRPEIAPATCWTYDDICDFSENFDGAKSNQKRRDNFSNARKSFGSYCDNISIYDRQEMPQMDFEYICDIIKLHADTARATGEKPPIVLIDFLQILKGGSEESPDGNRARIDDIVIGLQGLAKATQAPIILISSFNRQAYGKEATKGSFKESGGIEYAADCLLSLELIKEELSEDEALAAAPRLMKVRNLKSRYRATGKACELDYYSAFNILIDHWNQGGGATNAR